MSVKDTMTPSRMNEKAGLVVNPTYDGSHVNHRGNVDAWVARRSGVAYAWTRRGCEDGGAERSLYRRPHPKPVCAAAPEEWRSVGVFPLGLLDMEKVLAKQRARFSVEGRTRRLGVGMGRDSRYGVEGLNLNRRHGVAWEIINEKRGSTCSSVK